MATKKIAKRKVLSKKSAPKTAKKSAKPKGKAKKAVKKKTTPKAKTAPKKKVSPTSKKTKKSPKKVKVHAKKTGTKTIKAKATGNRNKSKKVSGKKTNPSKKPATLENKPKEAPEPEKPLDPVFAKIRQNLLASRSELFKMVESSQELERNVSDLTFSNEIDLASSLEGREMVFQLASRDRNGLKLIDDALFKMTHGTYGICEGCAKPIGIKRLQILPLTQFCIECQSLMEHVT